MRSFYSRIHLRYSVTGSKSVSETQKYNTVKQSTHTVSYQVNHVRKPIDCYICVVLCTGGEQRGPVLRLRKQRAADVLEQFLLRAHQHDDDWLRRHFTAHGARQSVHRRLRRRSACT